MKETDFKILAVIPVGEESRQIPNKYTRFLAGRPLISYSIHRALESKYISDVIILTDLWEIQIIAAQMGVACEKAEEKQFDPDSILKKYSNIVAKENGGYDYLVIIYPDVPTLKTQTLDHAIEHMIRNDMERVYSVRKETFFFWEKGEKNSESKCVDVRVFAIMKISDTAKRENLKAYHCTLPWQETIEIQTFYDMQNAEMILSSNEVAMYVNGNKSLGMGHIYRILGLADEFCAKPDIYYNVNQTDPAIFGNTMHNLIPVNNVGELYAACEKSNYIVFINDILDTSTEYMERLRKSLPKSKIVNFEDAGAGGQMADLVINALYQESSYPNMLSGEQYYIAPKLFLLHNAITIKEQVEAVFICFGGADPRDYTRRIMNIISKDKYQNIRFVVAVGRAYGSVEKILEYNRYPNMKVIYDVANMPELMSECDIAITSRGRTGYELALMGIPTISLAQNEQEETHAFIDVAHGFRYLGMNPRDSFIEANLDLYIHMNKEDREEIQKLLLKNDLRSGRARVLKMIKSL
ncbi:MAG: cytidyltransferase [Ruminococcus flavefaciens]|nr:cytidyltransferase [Ruminococcus flavefaciens]